MKIIFGILCGLLYVIGLCFGLNYQQISIVVCIYMCPAICILCAAATTIHFRHIKSFKNILPFSFNAFLTLTYCWTTKGFWEHYGMSDDPFNLCKYELTRIARDLHMTYEEVNIYIYCYLFFGIIIFHLGQILISRLIRKRRKARLLAAE